MKKFLLYITSISLLVSFLNVLLIGLLDKNVLVIFSRETLNSVFVSLMILQFILTLFYVYVSNKKEIQVKNTFLWAGLIGSILNLSSKK